MLWVLTAVAMLCTVSMIRGQLTSCLPPSAVSPASECLITCLSRSPVAAVVCGGGGGGGGGVFAPYVYFL